MLVSTNLSKIIRKTGYQLRNQGNNDAKFGRDEIMSFPVIPGKESRLKRLRTLLDILDLIKNKIDVLVYYFYNDSILHMATPRLFQRV